MSSMSPSMKAKLGAASALYRQHFADKGDPTAISVAPGRVNLIGEHTDYTGGFVLPFAIEYSTVVVGSGTLRTSESEGSTRASISFVSSNSPTDLKEHVLVGESTPPATVSWESYVLGTVFQYLEDLPKSSELSLNMCISGDVPLGSGLSSSASLEVTVARFVETVIGDLAFKSAAAGQPVSQHRALRCQKAENEWCQSPCGIMDQYVSSAAKDGSLLLIDCTTMESQETKMAQKEDEQVVLVVTDSRVKHDIAGGEYPVRVEQCKTATRALTSVNPEITTLREATMEDVEMAVNLMDETSYKRAKHVVPVLTGGFSM